MTPTSAPTEPVHETRGPARVGARTVGAFKAVEAVMLGIAVVFFALHFVHLRADFPNHSIWMDWAKYTDEGWYGDAAVRHYQLGHWYVSGDFNPAVALPVWPLVETAIFRFTGVSLAAARALTVTVFGLCLLGSYLLIRRWGGERTLAPAIAVLLLAVSPFCFVFMRLAILEPMLILLTLISLLVATSAGAAPWSGESVRALLRDRRNLRPAASAVALGLLLPAMVLTKTTVVFLFPCVFWTLWAASGYRLRPFLRVALIAGTVGALIWSGYYGFFVRPHYLVDYRYLFAANAYTGITRATFWAVLYDALADGAWIGTTLYALALVAIAASVVARCTGRFRGAPLAGTLLLWIFGYGAFLAYHDNLQPRYYVVIAIPLTMLVAIAFDAVLRAALATADPAVGAWLLRTIAGASAAALVFATIHAARQTISFVRHPEYSFLTAANQVRDVIDREPGNHPRLLLSVSGANLSLMTGLPTICDEFGAATLYERLSTYKPGWFATWNAVDDDKMAVLGPMYRVVRVGAFPAFDDPERNLLILYRLDLIGSPGRERVRRRFLSVPHRRPMPPPPPPTHLKP